MLCPKCNQEISDDSKVCPFCNFNLLKEEPSADAHICFFSGIISLLIPILFFIPIIYGIFAIRDIYKGKTSKVGVKYIIAGFIFTGIAIFRLIWFSIHAK